MHLRWNSIHAKLLGTYLALTALGTFLLGGYLLWSFYLFFMKTKQAELETWTKALGQEVADALKDGDLGQVDRLVRRYGEPETMTLRVFTPQGDLLSTSVPQLDQQVEDWSTIPGMEAAMSDRTVNGIAKGVLSNDDRLYTMRPLGDRHRRLGILRLSITLTQFQHQFRSLIVTVFATVLFIFLLCALLSAWLARSIALPILAMRDFAVRLGRGHLGEKLTLLSNDELGELAQTLNRMSERLASVDQERRKFLSLVSHELRTPVSNVKVTLEALERGAIQNPTLRDRFMQTAQAEITRLSRLIEDLLNLGRLEAGVTLLDKQTISLRSLVGRAVQAIELRAVPLGVKIEQNVADVKLQVDSERLLQAFLNILDNAIKYSPAHSTVSIVGGVESDPCGDGFAVQVSLKIQDSGMGIDERDLPHIFEEFYRSGTSAQGDGTGLGLAISQRIVKAHGGDIRAESITGRGATFTIRLPL